MKETSLQSFSNNIFDKAYVEVIEANKIFNLINKYVDIIFANETEIQSLYQSNLQESLKKIRKVVEIGAITLGSKGSIVFQNQVIVQVRKPANT